MVILASGRIYSDFKMNIIEKDSHISVIKFTYGFHYNCETPRFLWIAGFSNYKINCGKSNPKKSILEIEFFSTVQLYKSQEGRNKAQSKF